MIDSDEDQMALASPSSIPLYLIDGVATVWDAQVAATLHCVHNVSGLRVGTLPGVASQNGFLGLPITLMQEETAYLVRQGIAHLVPVNTRPSSYLPSSTERQRYTAERLARIRSEEAASRVHEAEKEKRAKEKFAQAGAAAQAKREARAKARAEKAALAARQAEGELFGTDRIAVGNDSTASTAGEGEALGPAEATTGSSTATTIDSRRHLLASSPDSGQTAITGSHFHVVSPFPHFPHLSLMEPITEIPHPLFPFPRTTRDRALLATFTRLQQLGLRVGLGPRFGGEYLVYPGDYLRYHAHFTSQVLVSDEVIRPVEIVAWGRLGTGTKKAGLLCCWSDDREEGTESGKGDKREEPEEGVEFYSLEWANFG